MCEGTGGWIYLICVNKSSVFMAREITGTDLWSHQSHILKQNVTRELLYIMIINHIVLLVGFLIKHIKCFRIILLYIKGMMKKDIHF